MFVYELGVRIVGHEMPWSRVACKSILFTYNILHFYYKVEIVMYPCFEGLVNLRLGYLPNGHSIQYSIQLPNGVYFLLICLYQRFWKHITDYYSTGRRFYYHADQKISCFTDRYDISIFMTIIIEWRFHSVLHLVVTGTMFIFLLISFADSYVKCYYHII